MDCKKVYVVTYGDSISNYGDGIESVFCGQVYSSLQDAKFGLKSKFGNLQWTESQNCDDTWTAGIPIPGLDSDQTWINIHQCEIM